MTVATMAASGGNVYVARLLDRGFSDAAILQRLRREFPGEDTVSYNALLERGRTAERSGFLWSLLDPNERIFAYQVPDDGTGGLGFRFTTLVSVFDTELGEEQVREVVIESATNLTKAQLAAEVEQRADALYRALKRRGKSDIVNPDFVVTNLQVLAIERASV